MTEVTEKGVKGRKEVGSKEETAVGARRWKDTRRERGMSHKSSGDGQTRSLGRQETPEGRGVIGKRPGEDGIFNHVVSCAFFFSSSD